MTNKPVPAPGHDAPFLDEEEERSIREIEAAIDKGEIQPPSAERLDALRQEWREVLRETQKRKAVTLRLQERDILRVKTIARELGIPYQTFLASVIHRVATGEISVR
ncbi:MAG: hypothetical protein OXF43_10625 [Gammaproteobacteria bacterium]|nr:hypothetical protein [Gammaproteobacteria bacterium]